MMLPTSSQEHGMLDRLTGRLRAVWDDARARQAAAAARRRAAALPRDAGADAVVDFILAEGTGGIEAWQVDEEFRALARLVERRRPRTVLEIGTADGGTLFAHARLAHHEALIVSIDLPHGPFGGGYPPWRIPLYESFAGPGQELVLLRVDSHAPSTVDLLSRVLGGRRIDYAFIDGDHTFDGVRQDFELCLRFAAPDAVIAFHDIAPNPSPEWIAAADASPDDKAVRGFWEQVKRRFAHQEFIRDRDQAGYGIGVLYPDRAVGGPSEDGVDERGQGGPLGKRDQHADEHHDHDDRE
jgi:predicted O-methyltransferase YrrM